MCANVILPHSKMSGRSLNFLTIFVEHGHVIYQSTRNDETGPTVYNTLSKYKFKQKNFCKNIFLKSFFATFNFLIHSFHMKGENRFLFLKVDNMSYQIKLISKKNHAQLKFFDQNWFFQQKAFRLAKREFSLKQSKHIAFE